jgi:hypothetical protein
MHEERTLAQRAHRAYQGHLATNVRYLMDYILGGLCLAPGMPEVTNVPIKLWVRYMPDTIDHIMRAFYLPEDVFFDSAPEPPEVTANGNATGAANAASAPLDSPTLAPYGGSIGWGGAGKPPVA